MRVMDEDIMSEALRSLVARVLFGLRIILTKCIAITRLRLNITNHLMRVGEEKFNKGMF